jgi:hypothetical protein
VVTRGLVHGGPRSVSASSRVEVRSVADRPAIEYVSRSSEREQGECVRHGRLRADDHFTVVKRPPSDIQLPYDDAHSLIGVLRRVAIGEVEACALTTQAGAESRPPVRCGQPRPAREPQQHRAVGALSRLPRPQGAAPRSVAKGLP